MSVYIQDAHKYKKDLYWISKANGKNKRFYKKEIFPCYIIFDDNSGYIPMYYARMKGIKCEDESWRYAKVNAKFTRELWQEQKYIYSHMMTNLSETGTSFISACCGAGKTTMAIKAIVDKGLRAFVLFTNVGIRDQWEKEIKSMSTLTVCILENYRSGKKEIPEADVYLSMKADIKYVDQLFKERIGMLISDETRLECKPSYAHIMLQFRPKYAIALSADYERSDGFHIMIDAIFGRERISVVDKRPFTIVKINTIYKPINTKNLSVWTDVEKEMSSNKDRNDYLIQEFMKDLNDGRKPIVISRRIAQLEYLFDELSKQTKYKVGRYWKDDKGYLNCDLLLVCVQKGGVGFDSSSACIDAFDGRKFDCVHLITSMKNVLQYIGRARADKVTVKDYVDDMKTFRDHYLSRCEYYTSLPNAKFEEQYQQMII